MKLLNCCIVCYKNVDYSPSSTPNKNEECVTARFIRLFQKHIRFSLETTQLKIRNSSLTFLPRNGSENEAIRFQVCETCSQLLSSFNSLYGDIKCAEMRANRSLQKLANILRFADCGPTKRTKVRESLHDLEEDTMLVDNAVEIISKFRKQLQHKCRVWYKNQFSRVVLMKTNPGEISEENRRKYDDPDTVWFASPAVAKSKSVLIATALKNLSSLQLVLYLALYSPELSNTDLTFSAYTECTEREQEPENTFCYNEETKLSVDQGFPIKRLQAETVFKGDQSIKRFSSRAQCNSHLPEHKISVEGSPALPSSPVSIADDVDGVECFPSEDHEVHKVRNPTANGSSTSNSRPRFKCHQCIKTFSSRVNLDNNSKEQHDYTECSPPSSPICSTNDNRGEDNEWNASGHGIDRSKLGDQYDDVHNFQNPLSSSSQFVVYLKQEDDMGTDQADHECDYSQGAPGALDDMRVPTVAANLIPKIEPVTTHSCIHCQLEFDSMSELEQHLVTCSIGTQHTPDAIHVSSDNNVQIQQEPIKSPNKINTKRSPTNSNGSVKIYRCGQCAQRCKDLATLSIHKLRHLDPDAKKHMCSYCEKKFIRKECLDRHLRVHTGERPFACPEDNCQKRFKRKDHVKTHLKTCANSKRKSKGSIATQALPLERRNLGSAMVN